MTQEGGRGGCTLTGERGNEVEHLWRAWLERSKEGTKGDIEFMGMDTNYVSRFGVEGMSKSILSWLLPSS